MAQVAVTLPVGPQLPVKPPTPIQRAVPLPLGLKLGAEVIEGKQLSGWIEWEQAGELQAEFSVDPPEAGTVAGIEWSNPQGCGSIKCNANPQFCFVAAQVARDTPVTLTASITVGSKDSRQQQTCELSAQLTVLHIPASCIYEVVDSNGNAELSALGLDAQERPVLLYSKRMSGSPSASCLHLARRNSAGWQASQLPLQGVSTSGLPFCGAQGELLLLGQADSRLYLLESRGSQWSARQIASSVSNMPLARGFVAAASDKLHVLAGCGMSGLLHSVGGGQQWSSSCLAQNASPLWLEAGRDGALHALYEQQGSTDRQLVYRRLDQATAPETIATPPVAFTTVAARLDQQQPWIAFRDKEANLVLASFDGASWTLSAPLPVDRRCWPIGLDAKLRLHLLMYDHESQRIEYFVVEGRDCHSYGPQPLIDFCRPHLPQVLSCVADDGRLHLAFISHGPTGGACLQYLSFNKY